MTALEDLDRRARRELTQQRDRPQRVDERVVTRDEGADGYRRPPKRRGAVDAQQVRRELATSADVGAEQVALIVRELLGRDLRRVGEERPVEHRERGVAPKRTEQRTDGRSERGELQAHERPDEIRT